MRKRTIEEINEIYHKSYPYIDVIEFNGYGKKSKLLCHQCGLEWERNYGVHNCPNCSKSAKKILYKNRYGDKYKEKLSKTNIEILEDYKNNFTPILHRCKSCGYEWYSTPSNILESNRVSCPKCTNKYKMTHEEFCEKLENKYPKQFNLHNKFTGLCNNISATCNCCGTHMNKQAHSLLENGCRVCNATIANTELFNNRLKEMFDDDIVPIDDYFRANRKMKFYKKSCGHEFVCTPNRLFTRGNCPICNMSIGETRIYYYLRKNNINFISQKTFEDLRGENHGMLPYDFYLPDHNILIEFQGEQHERPIKYFGGEKKFKVQKIHDQLKRDYAIKNNITLLEIWYWDIKNITDILNKALGLQLSA